VPFRQGGDFQDNACELVPRHDSAKIWTAGMQGSVLDGTRFGAIRQSIQLWDRIGLLLKTAMVNMMDLFGGSRASFDLDEPESVTERDATSWFFAQIMFRSCLKIQRRNLLG